MAYTLIIGYIVCGIVFQRYYCRYKEEDGTYQSEYSTLPRIVVSFIWFVLLMLMVFACVLTSIVWLLNDRKGYFNQMKESSLDLSREYYNNAKRLPRWIFLGVDG